MVDIPETEYLMETIIECRNLTRYFGNIKALDDLNIVIPARASVGLVGPNGAGKTTLFAMLCGFLHPTRGSISVLGHKPDSEKLKGRIGILPQDIPLMRGISVHAQMILFARLQGFTKTTAGQEIDRIIQLVNIGSLIKQFPETLSHGQRKRITLAQALIGKPDLILLDEPTSGLDPVAANDVRAIIQKLRHEHSLIISSHNLDEIKNVCDEIIIIDKGKLVRHSRIDDLIERNNILSILLDQAVSEPLVLNIKALPSVVRVDTDETNPYRLSVVFQAEKPDQIQFKILEQLQQSGVGIVEFNRGSAFTDRVVELVSKH
jgi:ABC-2 type transport system ATP-binding protein